MRTLAVAPNIQENEFDTKSADVLTEELFQSLNEHYAQKSKGMANQAFPVFQQIREAQGSRIENVVVPLTDGTHEYQITVPIVKALESSCLSMVRDFEKSTTLQNIDDEWKEHLRELDELKQSTSNAQYEQKDPLLIYKIESFELYGQMLQRLNQKILGMLFRTRIFDGGNVSEAKAPEKRTAPKTIETKDEMGSTLGPSQEESSPEGAPKPILNPIRNELKVGRNDTCPCGSGKKFKQCHGRA
jgi:preprotein translocase subunit SecA